MTVYNKPTDGITMESTSAVPNPWFEFIEPVIFSSITGQDTKKPKVFSSCQVILLDEGIRLFFKDSEIAFVFTEQDSTRARYLINPLSYFISYSGFVELNHFYGCLREEINDQIYEIRDEIVVNLTKVSHIEDTSGLRYEEKPHQISIAVEDLRAFVKEIDFPLFYAIASYLTGSRNRRYFLIDFYKSVEAIMNALGEKKTGIKKLKPYGLNESLFSDFGKYCNDDREAPIDIGRHAPQPGSDLFAVDLRNLLSEPKSRKIFETGVSCCRQVIDAYIKLRILAK